MLSKKEEEIARIASHHTVGLIIKLLETTADTQPEDCPDTQPSVALRAFALCLRDKFFPAGVPNETIN